VIKNTRMYLPGARLASGLCRHSCLEHEHVPADEDTLVRQSNDRLPAAALALSTKKVWEVIRSQRDLNLPAHKVRCRSPEPLCSSFQTLEVHMPRCKVPVALLHGRRRCAVTARCQAEHDRL